MTDFNFLRIKWPKLAAIAADAGRLVEVSPASAISTMQNFCEWAADIALDFYEINTQNGITQQEKIDTLKATGHVPADILERYRDVMLAGGRRLYRDNEDVEEARRCIDDVYEIGRWLNKEADRAGWPPRSDYYRPVISSMGLPGESSSFSAGKIGQVVNNFKPIIIFAAIAIVIIVAAVWGISSIVTNANAKETAIKITQSPPKITSTPLVVTMPGDEVTPTPKPEVVKFLDELTPTSSRETFYLKQWKFKSKTYTFRIGDKQYVNGIGMYIASNSISHDQGTASMKFTLDDEYEKLRFDLGADSDPKWYGTGYGRFRIQIYCNADKEPVYDSGLKEHDFTDLGKEVNIEGCKTLTIKITEAKGTKGTINVVLGDIRLVKGGAGEAASTDGGAATGTATNAASSSPGTTPDGTGTAATATATATATADGEQQPPPT